MPANHHGRVVEFRSARQQRLLDEQDPLRLTAVIEETTLDRLVGGADVMREQLDHLLAMSERDNVSVQVMPQAVAVHDGLDGEFVLLHFPGAQSIGYAPSGRCSSPAIASSTPPQPDRRRARIEE